MQITGEIVTLFVIILTAIAGVWYKVELKIDAAKDKAEAAAAELALYKTHIAENYITKSGLHEFRDEIMHGIREVKGDLDHITDRLDRVFEVTKPARRGNGGEG